MGDGETDHQIRDEERQDRDKCPQGDVEDDKPEGSVGSHDRKGIEAASRSRSADLAVGLAHRMREVIGGGMKVEAAFHSAQLEGLRIPHETR